MNDRLAGRLADLDAVLADCAPAAVAVSGGVDSMTLADRAQARLGAAVRMFHAASPAVPAEATRRVRAFARRRGWRLRVLDAGELRDPDYRNNPVDRCFYCKTRLYAAIRRHTGATLLSGANTDDLGEYRPGLDAARRFGVRHPFLEAGIDKASVRALARHLGLDAVADLPAQPCLASRIETGIGIRADVLSLVHAAEKFIAGQIDPGVVRCRVRARGISIELDAASLAELGAEMRRDLGRGVSALFGPAGLERPVEFAPYRAGSAFLHPARAS